MTIMMQKPDATMCQSFTGWKEMGRFVKKGEKGIRFMAPAPYKMERDRNIIIWSAVMALALSGIMSAGIMKKMRNCYRG